MKFDMGQAWSQALQMLSANRDLIGIVAGVFFFLPYLALVLLVPEFSAELPAAQAGADPEAMYAEMMALYAQVWPYIVITVILQAIGSLALLALLRDSSRPTLGEALKQGAVAFLPYLAAQLIVSIVVVFVAALLVGGAYAINPALGVLVFLVAAVVSIYVFVKASLVMPIIAIERLHNPIGAIARSWRLTKGNSFRLFAFYVLIVIAALIVTMVVQVIFGLVFALFGPEGQAIGNGLIAGFLNAAMGTLMLAVIAAAHHQLAGGRGEAA